MSNIQESPLPVREPPESVSTSEHEDHSDLNSLVEEVEQLLDDEPINPHIDLETGERRTRNPRVSVYSYPSVFSGRSHHDEEEKEPHFFSKPYFSSLLFENSTSEARDLDAAERNFLSWVRMAIVLAVSGTAIMINLRFKDYTPPSESPHLPSTHLAVTNFDEMILDMAKESRSSLILGIVFFVLAIICLFASLITYISTVNGFVKQHIVVTNSLTALGLVVIIAITIIASNIMLLKEDADTISFLHWN